MAKTTQVREYEKARGKALAIARDRERNLASIHDRIAASIKSQGATVTAAQIDTAFHRALTRRMREMRGRCSVASPACCDPTVT